MDRNEAIDILRVIAPPRTSKKAFYDFMEARDMAVSALEGKDINVPNKWIPCSERLPEEGQEILATTDPNGWYDVVIIRSYYAMIHKSVIAWMPLPQPYGREE